MDNKERAAWGKRAGQAERCACGSPASQGEVGNFYGAPTCTECAMALVLTVGLGK